MTIFSATAPRQGVPATPIDEGSQAREVLLSELSALASRPRFAELGVEISLGTEEVFLSFRWPEHNAELLESELFRELERQVAEIAAPYGIVSINSRVRSGVPLSYQVPQTWQPTPQELERIVDYYNYLIDQVLAELGLPPETMSCSFIYETTRNTYGVEFWVNTPYFENPEQAQALIHLVSTSYFLNTNPTDIVPDFAVPYTVGVVDKPLEAFIHESTSIWRRTFIRTAQQDAG